jgi:hypothetical protein
VTLLSEQCSTVDEKLDRPSEAVELFRAEAPRLARPLPNPLALPAAERMSR